MVLIINGEVVPDSDPRAIAMRGRKSSGATTTSVNSAKKTGISSLYDTNTASNASNSSNNNNNTRQQQQQQQGNNNNNEDGILAPLAVLLKVEGKKVVLPPIHQVREYKMKTTTNSIKSRLGLKVHLFHLLI